MNKKILCFSIILFISVLCFNASYATNIVTGFENIADGSLANDDTLYSTNTESISIDETMEEEAATITTTDYENETELSISNMINIVLIAVGVVLIFLGIAIIIKLK